MKISLGPTLLIIAASLSLGFHLGQQKNERPLKVRQQLLGEMQRGRTMLDEYFANMKNQFTPGYKAFLVFDRLPSGRSRLRYNQGEVFKTQKNTDLAINGDGFFMLRRDDQVCYTRDGRFTFKNSELRTEDGQAVLGFKLDAKGNRTNAKDQLQTITLTMDPLTKLYESKYTGFHFDETGTLYGESTMTDPVTGQSVTANYPLAQLALASFSCGLPLTQAFPHPTLLVSEDSQQPVISVAGGNGLCTVCPGSLELSNVDFMEEGRAISAIKAYAGLLEDGSHP